jgi:hypothetical protein
VTPDPLILTARFDEAAEAWLDALRRAHFPPERNVIPAHVTLFHALPGAELATITVVLEAEAGATPRSTARLGPPRSLGRGVALGVQAPGLAQLRARLAMRWVAWLGPQDRQGWRPHATVQNKVTPDAARALLAPLCAEGEAQVLGLRLWHYRGGPWEPAGVFDFPP